jgi:hypothetical protein
MACKSHFSWMSAARWAKPDLLLASRCFLASLTAQGNANVLAVQVRSGSPTFIYSFQICTATIACGTPTGLTKTRARVLGSHSHVLTAGAQSARKPPRARYQPASQGFQGRVRAVFSDSNRPIAGAESQVKFLQDFGTSYFHSATAQWRPRLSIGCRLAGCSPIHVASRV